MECSISFIDNSKEFYEPAQKLKAELRINVPKAEKINKIECWILGYAKCNWLQSKGGNNGSERYHGREEYMKECITLLENLDDSQVELTAGQRKFDISYALSSDLPTSFKCTYGSIKYKIRVTIDRSWKLNSKFDFPFTIIRPLNLNAEGVSLRNPIKEELSKNFKMDFTSEPLYMSATIPFSGYVPGQTINVLVQVNNQSKTHVKEVKISLKKIVLLNSLKPRKRTKDLVLSEAKVSTDPVGVLTMQNFETSLVVPSLPPNITNCEVIQVSYELRVKAKTSGMSRSPKLKFPLTIGTTPLENRGDNIPNSPSCGSLPPPSYEDALRDAASGESSDGENGFHPRYPVFDYEVGESSTMAKNKK